MAKRSRARPSRASGVASAPVAVRASFLTVTAPAVEAAAAAAAAASNAAASAAANGDNTSDGDDDGDDILIPMGHLSLDDPAGQQQQLMAAETGASSDGHPTEEPVKALRFFDLPSELRVRIYQYHFAGIEQVLDLSPDNYKTVLRRLVLLRTCRRVYLEASHYFYSTHTFRIFPTHPGKFFKTRRPLLVRLSTRQRTHMTRLELRLGPGFNRPPKCWVVTDKLGLAECVNVRRINVFVQLDPSHSWLDGFRKPGHYEAFSCNLLDDILKEAPNVEVVEFDGYESVRKNCPMMEGLIKVTRSHGKKIAWGPRNGWTDADDEGHGSSGPGGGGNTRALPAPPAPMLGGHNGAAEVAAVA